MKAPRFRLPPSERSGDPRASALALFIQATFIAIIVPALIVPVTIDLMRDDSGGPVMPDFIVLPPSFCLDEFRQNDGGRTMEPHLRTVALLGRHRQARCPQQTIAEQSAELRLSEVGLVAQRRVKRSPAVLAGERPRDRF